MCKNIEKLKTVMWICRYVCRFANVCLMSELSRNDRGKRKKRKKYSDEKSNELFSNIFFHPNFILNNYMDCKIEISYCMHTYVYEIYAKLFQLSGRGGPL